MSRSLGWTLLTTRPPISISPPVMFSRPAIILSSVDLPQPEGPTSTANSPSAIETLTPRITWVPPKYFWTSRISTDATLSTLSQDWRGTFHDDVLRPAGLRPVDQILRRRGAKLPFTVDRVEGGMGRDQGFRVRDERLVRGRGLLGQHVEGGALEAAGIERRHHVVDLHDAAPRGVHQEGSHVQEPQHAGVDHAARLVVERHVQRDDVGLAEQLLPRHPPDVGGEVAVDEVGVAGDHCAEDVARDVRHALADAAEAEDAEREVRGPHEPPGRSVVPASRAHLAVESRQVADE